MLVIAIAVLAGLCLLCAALGLLSTLLVPVGGTPTPVGGDRVPPVTSTMITAPIPIEDTPRPTATDPPAGTPTPLPPPATEGGWPANQAARRRNAATPGWLTGSQKGFERGEPLSGIRDFSASVRLPQVQSRKSCQICHCEPRRSRRSNPHVPARNRMQNGKGDCFVAALLAMTSRQNLCECI
jgi:hypothetical protein